MFMAVPPQELNCEHQADRHPLLMDRAANLNGHEHVIGMPTSNDAADQSANQNEHEHVIGLPVSTIASTSASIRTNYSDLHGAYSEDNPSTSIPTSISQLPSMPRAISNSRNASSMRRADSNSRPNRSPLNSGMWISIELVVNVAQIMAALIVMSLSRHEHPRTPLFEWIIGYTIGCIATIPYLYWRYLRRNSQQDLRHSDEGTLQNNQLDSSAYADITTAQDPQQNGHNPATELQQATITTNTRINSVLNHFKVALDFFFAVWFIVGNVWVFSARSTFHDAPNMYRLCIIFLVFSCIGYALPFILCVMICCCLPCIVSIVGVREDAYHGRGATSESINALPSYKFKSKRRSREETENNLDSPKSVGGLVAAGTDKERIISAEDAVCCICLAKYVDNDELRELPCTHFFHKECVDKWLKINALCPLCKTEAGIPNDTLMGTVNHHSTRQLADV